MQARVVVITGAADGLAGPLRNVVLSRVGTWLCLM